MKRNYGRIKNQVGRPTNKGKTTTTQVTGRKAPTTIQQKHYGAVRKGAGRVGQQIGRKPSQSYVKWKGSQDSINRELKNFQTNLSYDNYSTKYNKLSAEARKYVYSPSKIYATEQYKRYRQYKQAQAFNSAYQRVLAHHKKGKLWAVAAYGEGLEQSIAQKMIKQGYSPAFGGLLQQQAQAKYSQEINYARKNANLFGTTLKSGKFFDIKTGKQVLLQNLKPKNVHVLNFNKTFIPFNKVNVSKSFNTTNMTNSSGNNSIFGRSYFK